MGNFIVYVSDMSIIAVPLPVDGGEKYIRLKAEIYAMKLMVSGKNCDIGLSCFGFDLPIEAVKHALDYMYKNEQDYLAGKIRGPRRARILKKGLRYEGLDGVLTYHGKGEFSSQVWWINKPPVRESVKPITIPWADAPKPK